MRHQQAALLDGAYVALNENDSNIISYLRRYKDQTILVAINMSSAVQTIQFNLAAQGITTPHAVTLLTDMASPPRDGALPQLSMDPYSVYIAKLSN